MITLIWTQGYYLILIHGYYWMIRLLPMISFSLTDPMATLRAVIAFFLWMGVGCVVRGIRYSIKGEPAKKLALGSIGEGIGGILGASGGKLIIDFLESLNRSES